MTKQPIAIWRSERTDLQWQERWPYGMPIYSMGMIEAGMTVERVTDRRFYIEWLDQHNPRTTERRPTTKGATSDE
jgi:hypothetical protein